MIVLSWTNLVQHVLRRSGRAGIKLFLLPLEELMIAEGKLVEGDKLLFPFSCWQGANAKQTNISSHNSHRTFHSNKMLEFCSHNFVV